jgi:LmbE family N-acetylglucosaminyl deacetylase/AcrR family transcriptional regulator
MKADPPAVDKTPSAGRPRDPRIDAAILGATADLLVEIGYANVTMAAVAERAGTTKTALYRRWSSKAELVHEAAFPIAPTALTAPEGDIVGDVRAMIAATRDVFTSPLVRAALPGLIADMAADVDLNTRVMSRFAGLFNMVRVRVAHAVARGEVHADVDPDRLIEVIGGATLLRLLLGPGRELDETWVDQTTAIVVHGVVPGSEISASQMQPFPADWTTALVLVPHPDDPEYGCAAAVAKWTAAGKTVHYALASRGEVGIAGMPPEEAGPLREREQRRSAAIVGVSDVQFWDFPDSRIRDTPALRTKIAETISALAPEMVITVYSGAEWGPGAPNQRDHIEFANAVAAAYDSLTDPPRWLFENGPDVTHGEVVDEYVEVAVASLTAHAAYLAVLDPETPIDEQARKQVDAATGPRPEFGGRRTVEFILRRDAAQASVSG